MQAYHHQQLASLNLPSANNSSPNLLIASQQMNTMQQQHQQQISLNNTYQNLVKPYLPGMSHCNNGLLQHNQQQQQRSSPMSTAAAAAAAPSVASFAAKLMSLDEHERQCLDTDHEIMVHINRAQSLVESRLQDIHAKNSLMSTIDENGRKLCQQPLNLNALALSNQRQQEQLQLQHHQQQQHHHHQQQQQQQHLLLSQNSYYNNYYAKQIALSQYAHLHQEQQQQQQQQLMFMASRLYNNDSHNTDSSNMGAKQQQQSNSSSQQANTTNNNNHSNNNLINTCSGGFSINATATTPLTSNRVNHQNNAINQQQIQQATAPALDLRTTPTRPMSALSATPSPIGGARAGSTGSAGRQAAPLPPKKMQSSEYKKLQLMAERGGQHERLINLNGRQYSQLNGSNGILTALSACENGDQNRNPTSMIVNTELLPAPLGQLTVSGKRAHQEGDNQTTSNASASNKTSIRQQQVTKGGTLNATTGKKYKGEFDEPTPDEVAARERQLNKPGHYHESAVASGECACVIGSEFRDKTKREAIESLDRWRSMDIEERIKWKWDVNDLPNDIHLCDIKKYEDLRRERSKGRADFGGASKRKPLSIRGTRQFLLMLYCLWGHPGREDPMQKDGYCPHCFAKIRTDNEQSTLVRVVNHFNMKHRRGANPRLSPHLESRNSPQLTSPQSPQVVDALNSVVEQAVAAVEQEVAVVRRPEDEEELPLPAPPHGSVVELAADQGPGSQAETAKVVGSASNHDRRDNE